jgi:predicted ester cyclase
MSVQENKEFIRRYYEMGASQVKEAAADGLKTGAGMSAWHNPGFMYHSVTGDLNLTQYMQTMVMLSTAFPDWVQTVEDVAGEGDTVAIRTVFTGTHLGNFVGTLPTGKKVSMKSIAIYHMKDGKLSEGWSVSDMMGLMQQIGIASKK